MSALIFSTFLLLIAGSHEASEIFRKPLCSDLAEILACPMNLAPVCGTDGNGYANECLLCVQRLKTKMDILILKDGNC